MFGSNQQQEKKKKQQFIDENGFIPFDFADMKEKNKKLITLGKYDPNRKHMTVNSGLNFQAICRYQGCDVFEEIVWVQQGFGQFDISFTIDNLYCPICSQNLEPTSMRGIGYMSASVKCQGKRVGQAKRVEWQDKETEGKLVKFEGYDGQRCEWQYLRFTVQKLK